MPKTHKVHSNKRHGKHHRQSKRYLKTYLPYLPLLVSIVLSMAISSWQPVQRGTLAYATDMSHGGLLQSTNNERSSNGQASLSLHSQLNSAAQAKANDMIARNYWSHNTPDGQEPWVFFDNAGYKYQKAGENLAYGFTTSSSTVAGWMNSPSHKANMLDSAFTEVGFGFANGSNYNNSGNQTVVVAMYGKPQTLGASNPAPAASPAPAAQPQAAPPAPQAPSAPTSSTTPQQAPPSPASPEQEELPAPVESTPIASSAEKPVNTDMVIIANSAGLQPISRAQAITAGKAPWAVFAVGIISGGAVVLLLLKHGLAVRHLVRNSEKLLLRQLHHPFFDSVIVGIIILAITLSRTVGFIG